MKMLTLHSDRQAPLDQHYGDDEIRERNGVWVVTIAGVWRGDYTRREHAVAALEGAQHDARRRPR
ncbi:MAG: hypothetical protein ACXIU7_08835 [Roseinatronobacter sp.]